MLWDISTTYDQYHINTVWNINVYSILMMCYDLYIYCASGYWNVTHCTNLFECARCLDELDYSKQWNHQDGGHGESPTDPLGPARVVVVVILQRLMIQKPKHYHHLHITHITGQTTTQDTNTVRIIMCSDFLKVLV